MFGRSATLLFAILFLVTLSFAQRSGRQPSTPPPNNGGNGSLPNTGGGNNNPTHDIELVIHVVYPNDHPVGENIAVRLELMTGGMIGQSFTDPEGQATFHGVSPGSYVVRLYGGDIKDTSSGIIRLESFDTYHVEYVHAPLAEPGNGTAVGSTQGAVSAAELNIPQKARKEYERGNEAFAKGDQKKAFAYYQRAVELYPKYAAAFNNLGAIYIKSNDKAHAREAWTQALEADPNFEAANTNLGRLDIMENNFSGAIAPLEKALASQPKSADVLLLMCDAQFMTGHYDQALTYAHKVHELDHQKYELVHIIAGRAHEAQNHPDLARAEYEVLLKEAPTAPEAAEARKSLERLGNVAQKQ